MVQVAEKLSILKMTPEERANYSYYQKKLYSDRDELAAAEARGIEKGKTKKAVEVAKTMLTKNKPMEEIVEFTGLTVKEIEKLK